MSVDCPSCREEIPRRTTDPTLDVLTHLAECGVLDLTVVQAEDPAEP
jgi:hypothetical protein